MDENPDLAERQKQIDEKKYAREKVLEDRKLLQEQKKKEFEDKRAQIIADREAKKNGTVSANVKIEDPKKAANADTTNDASKQLAEDLKQKQVEVNAQKLEDRKKILEDRKKALDEKRKKILEEREAIRKQRRKIKRKYKQKLITKYFKNDETN
jgi:lipopolysaccharide export LptBFGC system permease protein LptF